MKKSLVVLLILIIILCVGCSSSKEENISLYQRGLDLINEIDYLAEHEEITEIFYSDKEMVELCKKIGSYDYTKPKSVYEIKNILESTVNYFEEDTKIELSNEARSIIEEKLVFSFPSMINAQNGVKTLPVASILTKGNAFKNNMTENMKTYLYTFDDSNYQFIVTFINKGHGVVSAGANIIINDQMNELSTLEELKNYFHEAGLNYVDLVEITEQ